MANENEKVQKIRQIIESHFDEEIQYKELELEKINERIFQAQNMLDKLRVCIICAYYSNNGRLNLNEYINHPSICRLKCEHLAEAINNYSVVNNKVVGLSSASSNGPNEGQGVVKIEAESVVDNLRSRESDADGEHASNRTSANESRKNLLQMQYQLQYQQHFNIKVCVGNVSKYLQYDSHSGASSSTIMNQKNNQQLLMMNKNDEATKASMESSQYNQELITHKWMIYIRSSNCNKIENYIKKVIFYLHFSYKPYDVVEVKSPPFQLIRKGWGEFPVHVQIHFKDPRNKRIDITHQLKLDWTQTGLQTFGGESSQDVDLIVKPVDLTYPNESKKNAPTVKDKPSAQKPSTKPAQPQIVAPPAPESILVEEVQNIQHHHYQPEEQQAATEISQPHVVQVQHEFVDYGDQARTHDNQGDHFPSFIYHNENTSASNDHHALDIRMGNEHRLSPSTFISTDLDGMISSGVQASFGNSSTTYNQQVQFDGDYFNEIMRNFSMSDFQNSNSNSNDIVSKEAIDSFINENSVVENVPKQEPEIVQSVSYENQDQTSAESQFSQNGQGEGSVVDTEPPSYQTSNGTASFFIGQSIADVSQTNLHPTAPILHNQPSIMTHHDSKTSVQATPQPGTNNSGILKPSLPVAKPAQVGNSSSLAGLIQSRAAVPVGSVNVQSIDATASKLSHSIRQAISDKKLFPSFIKPIVQPSQPVSTSSSVSASSLASAGKSFVIYKVESSDVRMAAKDDQSSRGSEMERSDQSGSSAPASPQVIKKIRLGSEQLTKIRNGANPSEQPSRSLNEPASVAVDNEPSLARGASHHELTVHSKTASSRENEQNSISKSVIVEENNQKTATNNREVIKPNCINDDFIYTIDSLIEKSFKTSEQAFHHQQQQQQQIAFTFEALLRTYVQNYQIISRASLGSSEVEENLRNRNEFPFSARSIHEYYGWPYAKRKAIEWMRALYLKQKCSSTLTALAESSYHVDSRLVNLDLGSCVWSTKSVVLWLRSRGYTPLEYRHMRLSNFASQRELNQELDKISYVYSLAPVTDLIDEHAFSHDTFKLLNDQESFAPDDDEDQEIVIDDEPVSIGKLDRVPSSLAKSSNDSDLHGIDNQAVGSEEESIFVQTSEEKHVRDQLDSLNLKSAVVKVVPTNSSQSETSEGYLCNLVEKFILAACKRFADDLVRQSCSQVFYNAAPSQSAGQVDIKKQNKSDQPQSTPSEQMPSQRFPMELFVSDVYSTIVSHEKYDFLTNKYMARPVAKASGDSASDVDDDKNADCSTEPVSRNYKSVAVFR